jgi:hypothetical protein
VYAGFMDAETDIAGDPHEQIERLETRIDELAARLESCRKFILAARIAMLCGAMLLAIVVFGVIAFDARLLLGSLAALLGGIVIWGSNRSTADETTTELQNAEAERAALIAGLDLHVVAERPTLH